MSEIRVIVRDTYLDAYAINVVSGAVGTVPCIFDFDESWDGYAKTVVFYKGSENQIKLSKTVSLLSDETSCDTPFEVLLSAEPLYIGLYGTKDNKVKPTNWSIVNLPEGTYSANTLPPPASPDVYIQLLNKIEQYKQDNSESAAAAAASAAEAESYAQAAQASAESAAISEQNIQNAEADVLALKNSIETAEPARVAAESARVAAEQDRVNAENDRVSAETARKNAENARRNAEAVRVNAESERQSAEFARASAETARASAESARVTAEQGRVAAEAARQAYHESLQPYLNTFIETIGIGVEYGCEVTPTNPATTNTVEVSSGVAHMPDGQTFIISGQQVTLTGFSYGIVYIDSSGNIQTLSGSNIGDPVPATPDGALLLAEIYLYDGTNIIDASRITDKRKFTYGLHSYVKDKTFESVGARINEIEEDAQVLESRVGQTENEINNLQNRATAAEEDIDDLQITTTNHTAHLDQHDTELDSLKVYTAKLESELAALRTAQAQMSGDTRINLNGTGKITAVPKNAAVLGVGGTLKGMTLTNLISSGIEGWSKTGATLTESNGIIIVKGDGTTATPQIYRITGKANSQAHLYRAKIRVTNALCTKISYFIAGIEYTLVENPVQNQWYTLDILKVINNLAAGTNIIFAIRSTYATADNALNAVTEVMEVVLNDLTSYGLQSKTAAEMALLCPNYISGTQSTIPMRLRSINGNYFDGIWESGYYNITTGEKVGLSTAIRNKNKIPVPAGNIYISGLPSTSDKYALKYDINGNYIGNSYLNGNGNTVGSLTMPNAGYICFYATNTTVFPTQTQVELGTTATSYKARQESSCYIEPQPMHRLPNGVCDTVDLATGKRTINIKEYTIKSSDITTITTTYTNIDVVLLNKPADFIYYNVAGWDKSRMQALYIEGFAAGAGVSDDISIVYTMFNLNATNIGLIVPKGAYSDIAAARAAFAGKKIWYQLATPVIEHNVVTGSLLSYPKGLILCEPVLADAGVYNDGITILRTDYPIQSLETLCKINPDGTQSSLDVSAATITDAGTKITHPALSNGDIVAFTYFTASSGIIGENVYNYVNANNLVLGANGKYYRVGFAIDINGNISLTKTEVV